MGKGEVMYTKNLAELYIKLSATKDFDILQFHEFQALKSPVECAPLNFIFGNLTEHNLTHARLFFQSTPYSCITKKENLDDHNILKKNGFYPQNTIPEMERELQTYAILKHNPDITITQVTTQEEFEMWCMIINEVLGISATITKQVNYPAFTLNDSSIILYLGFYQNIPAATSMAHVGKTSIGISSVTTRKAFRRKGIGQAMTQACILTQHPETVTHATLVSTSLGYPLYEKMGFTLKRWIKIFARP